MPSIDELIQLMRGGVLTPQDTLGTYEAQEQARREKRIARKQAMAESQSEALDSLSKLALGAAGEPTDLQGVMRVAGAEQLFGAGRPDDALSQLFLPTGQTNYPGNAGLSRIDPTLPADEYSKMFKAAVEDARDGLEPAQTMNRLLNLAKQNFGPKTVERFAEDIRELVSKAYSG